MNPKQSKQYCAQLSCPLPPALFTAPAPSRRVSAISPCWGPPAPLPATTASAQSNRQQLHGPGAHGSPEWPEPQWWLPEQTTSLAPCWRYHWLHWPELRFVENWERAGALGHILGILKCKTCWLNNRCPVIREMLAGTSQFEGFGILGSKIGPKAPSIRKPLGRTMRAGKLALMLVQDISTC